MVRDLILVDSIDGIGLVGTHAEVRAKKEGRKEGREGRRKKREWPSASS